MEDPVDAIYGDNNEYFDYENYQDLDTDYGMNDYEYQEIGSNGPRMSFRNFYNDDYFNSWNLNRNQNRLALFLQLI